MFRWRITAFEDQGKYWDLPAERCVSFQFTLDADTLPPEALPRLRSRIAEFSGELEPAAAPAAAARSRAALRAYIAAALNWLRTESAFLAAGTPLDLSAGEGPPALRADLVRFMTAHGLAEQERRTAETYVLNPDSGEWIKGLWIVLAELGLQPCRVAEPRTADIFSGCGCRAQRAEYLLRRLAFVRALFAELGRDAVTLYRGMSTEGAWTVGRGRPYSSWSFSREVAAAFANLDADGRFPHAYLIKRTFPVDRLLLSYLETDAMNSQYREAEAVILHRPEDERLW